MRPSLPSRRVRIDRASRYKASSLLLFFLVETLVFDVGTECGVSETTVILGFEEPALQDEVLHYLDRLPRIRVVGAAADGGELERRIRVARPDAAVVSPLVLNGSADLDGTALFVVAERETTDGLRSALRAGARGFYLWPEEREEMAREAERSAQPADKEHAATGRVVAVHAARGGAGATFLATSLAAVFSARGMSTVLIDFDTFYADVTTALGVGNDVRTAADLAPVVDEMTAEHVDRVLYAHPRGFHALLAPQDPAEPALVGPKALARAADVLRSRFEAIVLHLPRSMEAALPGLEVADEVLVVVTLDVLAFRDAKRLLSYMSKFGLEGKCRLVVNRATRSEVVPEDAERVFGMRPVAILRRDRSVGRAQNRGEVVVRRSGHLWRQLSGLAKRVMEGGSR
jgi:pilus assembly protein CpaE